MPPIKVAPCFVSDIENYSVKSMERDFTHDIVSGSSSIWESVELLNKEINEPANSGPGFTYRSVHGELYRQGNLSQIRFYETTD